MKRLSLVLFSLLFLLFLISCNNEKIDLNGYQVVIPENASATIKYSAEIFSSMVEENYGVNLPIVTDNSAPQEKEILIGDTNRKESKTDTSLEKGEYLLFKKGNKFVVKGSGIYVGASLSALLNKHISKDNGVVQISNVSSRERSLEYKPRNKCENVIFMIGDGMGINHVDLAEKNGLDEFVARQFINQGWSITRSQSVIDGNATYTDSAASGTAMATGHKTMNGYIGLDKDGKVILNVREHAHSLGYKTGVITTDLITGATPSAYMCHNITRESTEELQAEIDALTSQGKIDYCKGDVGDNLVNETKTALWELSSDNSPFFIMIEEGQIDKGSHFNKIRDTISYVIRFNDAIEYATQFALIKGDTALIVTADHETGALSPTKYSKLGYTFKSSNHTNVNVPIFAIGAGTELFNGDTIENTVLADFVFDVINP